MRSSDITIIIPTFNEEKWIHRCIESLMGQTIPFKEMKILVVDGRSTDKTRKIVESLTLQYTNIRLLDNPHRIQAIAFNIGVKASKSPIIIRIDAHSLYDSHYVERIVKHLISYKYGNVGGRWIIKAQKKGLIPEANAIANQMRFAIGGAEFRVGNDLKEVETVPFGGFRRDVIEKVGLMNPSLPRGEDNEYNSRIRQAGYKILFDPEIIAYYYARDTFLGFIKQMYANGFSIGILFHCYRKSLGVRHLVPMLFVLSLIILVPLSFCSDIFLYCLIIELCFYGALDIIASICECFKYGFKYLILLPWLIPCIHIAYGIGTIIGLFKRKYN